MADFSDAGLAVIRARAPRNGAALEGLPGIARRLLRGEFDPASYRPHPADDSMLAYSCAQNRTIVRLAACGALPRSIHRRRAVQRTALRRASAGSQAGRSGPLHWLRSANIWQKGTSLRGGVRRLRGMTTILRKYHSVARCTLLGEMIEDTAHRYYYRPHVGGELTFADKESPAIHLTPCPACPDWPAGQQRGSAVGTNSR